MPQAVDLTFLIAAVVLIVAEFKRGFGKALFDFFALGVALLAANAAAPTLSSRAAFSPSEPINFGWSYGVCFTAFGVIALTASRTLDRAFQWHLGVMDSPLGAIAGVALAVVVLHGAAIMLNFGGAGVLAGSAIGNEALNFKTYHTIIDGFTALISHPPHPSSAA